MKNHSKKSTVWGFSLAEMLIVIGILTVLCSVAFPSLMTMKRQLRQMELDSKAELIYIAAQNQLVKLWTSGNDGIYTECSNSNEDFLLSFFHGGEDLPYKGGRIPPYMEDAKNTEDIELCYFTSRRNAAASGDIGRYVMVPGTMDDGLDQHSWIVEFDRRSGSVFAVFYSESESDDAFAGKYQTDTGWDYFTSMRVYKNRFDDGARIGYYDGNNTSVDDTTLHTSTYTLKPFLSIDNGEELTAQLTCYAPKTIDPDKLTFRLTLTDTNDPTRTHTLTISGNDVNRLSARLYTTTVTLDSLKPGERFVEKYGNPIVSDLLPGSPLEVTLTFDYRDSSFNSETEKAFTNSLFADETTSDTAYIACGRHLQNLDESSGVLESKIPEAVQTADIDFLSPDGKWWNVYGKKDSFFNFNERENDYQPKFKPIFNPYLQSYNGESYKIIGLHVNESSEDGAGLFQSIDGVTEKNSVGVALQNITLEAATVSGGGTAGALAGQVSGTNNAIDNCRVYLSPPRDTAGKVKTDGSEPDPWILGTVAGGIAGTVNSGGNLKITNSFASTVIQGGTDADGFTGGLIGGLIGKNDGTLTLETSYADSYLYGTHTGGLVAGGNVSDISNCYAAGFQTAETDSAGLVNGTIDRLNNSYTVCSMTGGTFIYGTAQSIGKISGQVRYLLEGNVKISGTEAIDGASSTELWAVLGEAFQTDTSDTKAYNLKNQTLDNYPYPRLTCNQHYGDWAAAFRTGSLVYYEQYNRTYGFFGGDADSTLRNDGTVTGDGYGVAYEINPENPLPSSLSVILSGYRDNKPVKIPVTASNSFTVTAGDKQYRVYRLPMDVVNAPPATDSDGNPARDDNGIIPFYRQATIHARIGAGETESFYYFNPHFAKTARRMENPDTPIPAPEANSQIAVRTPRHTYSMSLYYDKYYRDATKDCIFAQERDLIYTSYRWWDFYRQTADADIDPWIVRRSGNQYVIDAQQPIGKSGDTAFQAVYNGYYHLITDVSFASVSGEYVGMFGYNTGTLRNMVLAANYDADEDAHHYLVRRINQIRDQSVYMGVLAGLNEENALIDNCAVAGYYVAGAQGTIHAHQGSILYAGGMTGLNRGTISNSAADFPMINLSTDFVTAAYVGGFVGGNQKDIDNCYAIGHIEVTARGGKVDLGGFAAMNESYINNSYCAVSYTSGGAAVSNEETPSDEETSNIRPHSFAPRTGQIIRSFYLNQGTFTFVHKMRNFNAVLDLTAGSSAMYDELRNQREGTAYRARVSSFHVNTDEETYPFRAVITDGTRFVHYGDWQEAPVMGTAGVFYWEHEELGENNGYHFTYLGYDAAAGKDHTGNSLCYRHDDHGVITEFGYGVYVQSGMENALSLSTDENIRTSYRGILGNVSAGEFAAKFNAAAAWSLEEQVTGFKFYPFTTPAIRDDGTPETEGNGGYIYLDGQKGFGTLTLNYSGKSYHYQIAPFFANSIRRVFVAGETERVIRVADESAGVRYYRDYSAELGNQEALDSDTGNPFEIRSITQFQYINWKHKSEEEEIGNAHSVIIGSKHNAKYVSGDANYTQFPYLQYATVTDTGKQMPEAVHENRPVQYWKQTHDLDGRDMSNYTPIAALASVSSGPDQHANYIFAWFGGSYDGQSYKIQNLNIKSSAYSVGLFGVTVGANIKSVIMYGDGTTTVERNTTDSDTGPVKNSPGAYMLGGMIGVAYDYNILDATPDQVQEISNCAIAGYRIIDSSTQQQHNGGGNVGGLTGVASVNLKRCSSVVEIQINCTHQMIDPEADAIHKKYEPHAEYGSYVRVGGLTGAAQYYVTDCYSGGSITVGEETLHEFCKPDQTNEAGEIVRWIEKRERNTHIYVCGLAGSTFTSNFSNFTNNTSKSPEGHPHFNNCYTYMLLPNYEGTIRGVCLLAGAADRYNRKDSTIDMTNCYYLDSIKKNITFTPSNQEFVSSRNYSLPEDQKKFLNDEMWEKMLMGDLGINSYLVNNHTEPDNAPEDKTGGIPLQGVKYQQLRDWSGTLGDAWGLVTTTEGGAAIDGKYSFSGSSKEESKNYPFPTVIRQWDPIFRREVNVHYGAWPSDLMYWEWAMGSIDIFSNMIWDGDTPSYAEKDFFVRIKKEIGDRPEFGDNAVQFSSNIAFASGEPEFLEETETEYIFRVPIRALREGSATVTITTTEGESAAFHLTVTADGLEMECAPSSTLTLYQALSDEEPGEDISLRAFSVDHSGNEREYPPSEPWRLENPEQDDTLLTLTTPTDETASSQWNITTTGHGAGARNLSAVFRYLYRGAGADSEGTWITRTMPLHVRILGNVGLMDDTRRSESQRQRDGGTGLERDLNSAAGNAPSVPDGYVLALYETLTDDTLDELKIDSITVTPVFYSRSENGEVIGTKGSSCIAWSEGQAVTDYPYKVVFESAVSMDANYQYRGGTLLYTGSQEEAPDTVRVTMEVSYNGTERYTLSILMGDLPTHTITFDANGGTETMRPIWSGVRKPVSLPECLYERKGYHFAGWWVSNDPETPEKYEMDPDAAIPTEWRQEKDESCIMRPGGQIYSSYDMTVRALWAPNTYYVAFDANGGTGHMESLTLAYTDGNPVGILQYPTDDSNSGPVTEAVLPVPDGLTPPEFMSMPARFGGWNTERDGTGKQYRAGESIQNLLSENDAVFTLYAQWDFRSPLKLWSYLSDELPAPDEQQAADVIMVEAGTQTLENDDSYKALLEQLEELGHADRDFLTLEGWYTGRDADAKKVLNPDGTVVTEDVPEYASGGGLLYNGEATTLYARWTGKVYLPVERPDDSETGLSEETANYLPEKSIGSSGNYVIASPIQSDESGDYVYALGVDEEKIEGVTLSNTDLGVRKSKNNSGSASASERVSLYSLPLENLELYSAETGDLFPADSQFIRNVDSDSVWTVTHRKTAKREVKKEFDYYFYSIQNQATGHYLWYPSNNLSLIEPGKFNQDNDRHLWLYGSRWGGSDRKTRYIYILESLQEDHMNPSRGFYWNGSAIVRASGEWDNEKALRFYREQEVYTFDVNVKISEPTPTPEETPTPVPTGEPELTPTPTDIPTPTPTEEPEPTPTDTPPLEIIEGA